MKQVTVGFSLKAGQIIKILQDNEESIVGKIFEVEKDNVWNKDFKQWGSVKLKGLYPPRFTHKENLKLLS